MIIQNAIKKATKALGIEPKIFGNKYYFTKGNQELSFVENGGGTKSAICFKVRWLNDKDDCKQIILPGLFLKTWLKR
jgi:hypothetical protein